MKKTLDLLVGYIRRKDIFLYFFSNDAMFKINCDDFRELRVSGDKCGNIEYHVLTSSANGLLVVNEGEWFLDYNEVKEFLEEKWKKLDK